MTHDLNLGEVYVEEGSVNIRDRHRLQLVLKLTLLPYEDSRLKVGEPSACKALTTFAFLAKFAEPSAPSRDPPIQQSS